MKKKPETADEYVARFPKDVQAILKAIRKTVQDAVPEAEEVISYSVPAFKYEGWIFYIAAHTNHYTLACPPPFTVFKKFEKELSEFEVAKSSIKFPYDRPVPLKLISAMSKFRATENAQAKKKEKKSK